MKAILKLLVFISLTIPLQVEAKIEINGSNVFKQRVNSYLATGKRLSPELSRLINFAENSPHKVYIKPITEDSRTWHYSGKKSRSHTEADDFKKRGEQRNEPTTAIVYINVNRISKNHKSYKSGTLIHELVHAVDLINGKYSGDYIKREKRAVFFQNIWRNAHKKSLRKHYHKRFETTEYQDAIKSGKVTSFVLFYFKNNGIPSF